MTASIADDSVVEVRTPTHEISDEKIAAGEVYSEKKGDPEITVAPPLDSDDYDEKDNASDDVIIITGADAAAHLIPLRDDGEPALTFRSMFLATCLSAFQAVMSQIYQVRSVQFQILPASQTPADLESSSNQPRQQSPEPSSSSSRTSLVMLGLHSSLVVTN